ncbi:TetR family transcriptional regulator [Nocardiopsis coralliicola]
MTGTDATETATPLRSAAPRWTASALRRRPAQRRSLERVERLLHACAELLDEVGYLRLTTTETARRAGLPIGTLYQFFADKNALVRALAARNLEVYGDRVAEELAGGAPHAWTEVAVAAVDVYVRLRRAVPGFGVLAFIPSEPGEECAPARPDRDAPVAERLVAVGAAALGREPGPAERRRLHVAVEAADAVLDLAFRTDPRGDPRTIAECKDLVRAYLGTDLPGSGRS